MMTDSWLWTDVASKEPVSTISLKKASSNHQEVVTNSRVIASFNTIEGNKQTPAVLLIPGCPRRYVTWQGGQLAQYRDEMFVDENHFVNPRYPLESLIRAVEVCHAGPEKFDWQGVDLVTDRNNFRKLFATLESGIGDSRSEPFRIDLERLDRTVMLIRVERVDKEFSLYPTYGKNFEEVCTKLVDSQFDGSFHCIGELNFAGMRLLVRFEVDGAEFGEKEEPKLFPSGQKAETLDHMLAKMNLSKKNGEKFSDDSGLCYKQLPLFDPSKKSLPINGAHLVELTTRAARRGGFPTEKWAQMYFSGTGKLVLGRHQNGRVGRVEEFTLSQVEQHLPSGARPQVAINKMAELLKQIVDFVRDQPNGSLFSVIWKPDFDDSRESLRIFKRQNDAFTRVAPPSLMKTLIAQSTPQI